MSDAEHASRTENLFGLARHEIGRGNKVELVTPKIEMLVSKKKNREIWSLFSGAMGLDLGLAEVGLEPSLAAEWDRFCCETMRLNRPDLTLLEADVTQLKAAQLFEARKLKKDADVFLMVGGPPCQSFSTGGNRAAISDPRGNLIYEYLRLIKDVRPRYFVLENVANIITAALVHRPIHERPGKNWNLSAYSKTGQPSLAAGEVEMSADELSGSAIKQILRDIARLKYSFRFSVVDAADYGAPQHRLRFVLLASRDGIAPQLPPISHGGVGSGLLPFQTTRDAIYDLRKNPGEHSSYTPNSARYFALVPPGGCWRDLPEEMQKEALGPSYFSGGGKTGFFRRLSYEKPSPTVTTKANRKGTAMCHPEFERPLSVSECARLQGFPDDWKLSGAMNQKYQQIGNAVPTVLGTVIGKAILEAERAGRKLPPPDSADIMLERALIRLKSAAKNKRGQVRHQTELSI